MVVNAVAARVTGNTMFVETKRETRARVTEWLEDWVTEWLEDWARRHPRAFTGALALLTAALTLAMLLNPASPIVLYQGF